DARELRLVDPESREERRLASGTWDRPRALSNRTFAWSPDSRWIAVAALSGRNFRNVAVVPVTGGEPQPVSFLADSWLNTLPWSPDGTSLLFDTGQRTENSQLARVDLVPRPPKFREDQFRQLFEEPAPKKSGGVEERTSGGAGEGRSGRLEEG